jgi:hypothetical protein
VSEVGLLRIYPGKKQTKEMKIEKLASALHKIVKFSVATLRVGIFAADY